MVVDANIILSVVLGRRSHPVFAEVIAARSVVTSARAAEVVRHVLRSVSHLPPAAIELAEALLDGIEVVPQVAFADRLELASCVLAAAVASRDGSVSDAHHLACARILTADVWSHDRDFAGTGWPAWSNANLHRAISTETEIDSTDV